MTYKRGPHKTHCKRGHSLADARTTTRPNGNLHRDCRMCQRLRQKARYVPKPNGGRWPDRTPAERFWAKVKKSDGCWLWDASLQSGGRYGQFMLGGKPQRAHRVAWEFTFGPIPDGLVVCHHCDVTQCVRPDHLFLGTQADNVADMIRKGRRAS